MSRAQSILLCLLLACVTSAGGRRQAAKPPDSDAGPRAVLAQFVAAIEAQRWSEAYTMLSARWRVQLTPARLATDYAGSEAVGRGATARVKGLLAGGALLVVGKERAVLPVGEGRAAVVLLEGDAWKVDALE